LWHHAVVGLVAEPNNTTVGGMIAASRSDLVLASERELEAVTIIP